jgi:hypothetical protein
MAQDPSRSWIDTSRRMGQDPCRSWIDTSDRIGQDPCRSWIDTSDRMGQDPCGSWIDTLDRECRPLLELDTVDRYIRQDGTGPLRELDKEGL